MARKKSISEEESGGIPLWFMTYSDVITLLMTFFILLLTFATDQPESFKRLKTSLFGGKGSLGIADENLNALERPSLYLRLRPDNSRMTQRGSEMQPMYSDPPNIAMDKGLQALEDSTDLARLERMTFDAPLASFITDDGQLTSIALHHLKIMAAQMRKMPLSVNFEISSPVDLPRVIHMCDLLTNGLSVPSGSVGASIVTSGEVPPRTLRVVIIRTEC